MERSLKMKKAICILYIMVVVAMASATIVEKYQGTDYVSEAIYGAWWFCALWGIMAVLGLLYYLRHRVRSMSITVLHVSFVVILLGALLTHLTAKRGMMQLRQGHPSDKYITTDGEGMAAESLPFTLTLDKFVVDYHAGTTAAQDYRSLLTLTDGDGNTAKATVSMNNILNHGGYRFYQASYDDDLQGTVLSVYYDPMGIPVTYCGYALLFISLIGMLFDPKAGFRRLLRHPAMRKRVLGLLMLIGFANQTQAAPTTFPKETANKFGRLCILYNDRICPLETYALDLTKKLSGHRSYKGFSPEQVMAGFIFFGDEWCNEPLIHVKADAMKKQFGLSDYCSVNAFFSQMSGYVLGPLVEEYYNGQTDKLHQQVADLDNRIRLVMELRQGATLKVLPYTDKRTIWYSPVDSIPNSVEAEHAKYIRNVFSLMNGDVQAKQWERVNFYLDKMRKYQQLNAGASFPKTNQLQAEHIYNAIPFATILFIVNLTLGFLALGYTIYNMSRTRRNRLVDIALSVLMALSWLALTVALGLRWTISGNIPMSNGYETMIIVAWFVELVALVVCRKARIVLVFGFLLSGFFLLVSHISQMDPAIGQMMPVLSSPLLSVHVSVVMMGYALLSLTFLCALMGLTIKRMAADLQVLSQLFLYPALTFLGLGIFIGAIWANVSWGAYWSWDPKETWALITMMLYAIPLHSTSLATFRRPTAYHAYMAVAFLSIIITYFGVNYFLGGMHSYA